LEVLNYGIRNFFEQATIWQQEAQTDNGHHSDERQRYHGQMVHGAHDTLPTLSDNKLAQSVVMARVKNDPARHHAAAAGAWLEGNPALAVELAAQA
jgi:hypothetical protein